MRKILLFSLTALLILSSMAACGSKENVTPPEESESRVLYSDDTSSTSEDSESETSETVNSDSDSETKGTNSDKDKAASSQKSSDTSSTSSKKKTSVSSVSVNSSKKQVATTSVSSKKTLTTTSSSPSQKNVNTTTVTTESNTVDNSQTEQSSNNSSESAENSSNTAAPQPNENERTDVNADTDLNLDSDSDSNENTSNAGSFDESDFVATFSAGKINFGDDIESVKAILGEPLDVQEAPSCKYTGQLDKTFIFNECSINTYPNEDGSKDYVVGIVITSDDYVTAKGAKIGTTSEELIKIYGKSQSDDAPMRKYNIGNKSLSFYVEGDAVAEINYIWDN